MHLVLYIPHLYALSPAETHGRASALARLLAQSTPPVRHEDTASALAERYGVARQTDMPIAPIRAAALGIDTADAYWLAADPLALVVGQDEVQIGARIDDLQRAEADALVATLNAHFADDGLLFVAPRPDATFVRVAVPPRLATHPIAARSILPLRALLPEGPDGARWRRWQSEIQMLLHEHPVNAARERAGRAAANSVWFSHGGTLPAPASMGAIRTYADDGPALALAAHAGSPAHAVPASLDAALEQDEKTAAVVVALSRSAAGATVEDAWARPALRALDARRMASVTLIAEDAGEGVSWRAEPAGLRRRIGAWLARRDLEALLASQRKTA